MTKLNARSLSEHGNSELDTFTSLLKVMGLRLADEPFKPARGKRPQAV